MLRAVFVAMGATSPDEMAATRLAFDAVMDIFKRAHLENVHKINAPPGAEELLDKFVFIFNAFKALS